MILASLGVVNRRLKTTKSILSSLIVTTKIRFTNFVSAAGEGMKYPQSEPIAMPPGVEDWLEGELEARGINSVVYSPYIINLMQKGSHDDTYHRSPQLMMVINQ